MRTGAPWRAQPDAAGLVTWEINVDSTICRAHQRAAGARRDGRAQKEPPGGTRTEPDDHGLGRSRFDKLAVRFEATVLIAAIGEWL